jgi:hypothetical protein
VDAQLPGAPAAAALVKALLTRAAFGGMQCDTEMLSGYAGLWASRFMGLSAPPPQVPQGPAGATRHAPGAADGGSAAGSPPPPQLQLQQQQEKHQVTGAEEGGGEEGGAGPASAAEGGGEEGGTGPASAAEGGAKALNDKTAGDEPTGGTAASAWLSFLEACYSVVDGAPAASRAPRVTLVGPLQR